MIRVTVMYPKQDNGTFDYDYYLKNHMDLVKDKVGSALKKIEVGKGLGAPGGAPETYVTIANLYFDSVESFEGAFGPNAEAIMGDVPNFTNLQPVVQLEDVLLG